MTRKSEDEIATRKSGMWFRVASLGVFAAALLLISPALSRVHSATKAEPQATPLPTVPTVKLLAIGTFTAKATPAVWRPVLPPEMRGTAKLYLAGKIDQWYVKQDQSGVVFILNLTDPKEAQEMLAQLPFGQANLMQFQIIPMGPLSPLGTLLAEPTK